MSEECIDLPSTSKSSDYSPTVYKLLQKARQTGITSTNNNTIITSTSTPNLDDSVDKDSSTNLPPWLDPYAIKLGKEFVSKHFFLVFFTHFISLILLLGYIPVKTVLIKTGKSHTKDLALRRYLSTLSHVKLWYEDDLSKENSEAVRDVIKVRKIHGGVSQRMEVKSNENEERSQRNYPNNKDNGKALKLVQVLQNMNQDDNNNDASTKSLSSSGTGPGRITQLDMIVTQYCFMGLLTSFPKRFGVTSPKDLEGLKGFIHIWAVVGYLLGIEDEFNLCINENVAGTCDNKLILKDFILKEILLCDLFTSKNMEETYGLWESLVNAMSEFVPCLSINSALLYILDYTLKIEKSDILYKNSSFYDRFCYHLTVGLFNWGFVKMGMARGIFNSLLRLAIYLTALRLSFWKMMICAK